MLNPKKILFSSLILIFFPFLTHAMELRTGENINIAQDSKINETVASFANIINIDGEINGDLFCAGRTININGQVNGDVICAGNIININGQVNGDVRLAAGEIYLNSNIKQNATLMGANIVIKKDAVIEGEIISLSSSTKVEGTVMKNAWIRTGTAEIAGKINGNADIKTNGQTNKLILGQDSEIDGNLNYTSVLPADINQNAEIKGSTKFNEIKINKKNLVMTDLWNNLIKIFSALVIGLVIVSLGKKQILPVFAIMKNQPVKSILFGALTIIVTPVIILLLIFTMIGLPIALIILAFYLTALYAGKIIAAIYIGQLLNKQLIKKEALMWPMIIGITTSFIIFSLPIIGFLLAIAATFWSLGALWLYMKNNQSI